MVLFTLLTIAAISPVCYANSAQLPSVLIIVPGAPKDLQITIGLGSRYLKAGVRHKTLESHYTFYSSEFRNIDDYTLKVSTNDTSFEIPLPGRPDYGQNIFTLDLKNQKLIPGKSLSRSIILIFSRVILTLLIEGLVFFYFKYRRRESWIAFIIINLLTQGYLNIWLNSMHPFTRFIFFTLVSGEILVFIAEMIAFPLLVREHGPLKAISYAFTANLVSLLAGGFILTVLPI
jgi:hypothetical protein